MYYYVYDEFVQDKKYEKDLHKIETRLTDLGIQGKIGRLALFKEADELVRDEVARGIKTVVVVGNDNTVKKVLNAVVETGVVLGIIPLGESNDLARLLGIPIGVDACDVLSVRVIQKIDTGMINKRRFIFGAQFPRCKAVVDCGKYKLSVIEDGEISIRNLIDDEVGGVSNPQDGKLDLVIKTAVSSGLFSRRKNFETAMSLKNFYVSTPEPIPVSVDGDEMSGVEFALSAEKGKLKAVVSKQRPF